jgi:hypothetical protein
MKTKTYFAFRIDVWDAAGDNRIEHLAGLDDYGMAVAAYWTASRVGAAKFFTRSIGDPAKFVAGMAWRQAAADNTAKKQRGEQVRECKLQSHNLPIAEIHIALQWQAWNMRNWQTH